MSQRISVNYQAIFAAFNQLIIYQLMMSGVKSAQKQNKKIKHHPLTCLFVPFYNRFICLTV